MSLLGNLRTGRGPPRPKMIGQDLLNLVRQASARPAACPGSASEAASERAMNAAKYAEMAASAVPWGRGWFW